jgi:hypothetical protein
MARNRDAENFKSRCSRILQTLENDEAPNVVGAKDARYFIGQIVRLNQVLETSWLEVVGTFNELRFDVARHTS